MSNLVEDEILDHFEAEPLARFVYSRHEGQCYYSSLTQCFYEVDHWTNLWVESKKGDILYKKINDTVKTFLCQKIQGNQEIIRTLQGNLSSEQYTTLIQETIKYERYISKINGEKLPNGIRKDYQQLCVNNEFPNALNIHPYQIAFQNGMYDLRQRSFREGIRDADYLTCTLDYDYEPVSDLKKTVQVMHLLKMICNFNEEHMDYYLSILAYALLGIPYQEKSIYFLLGQSADNGKSTLFNTLTSILPIYVKSLDSQAMEESYEKKHKWIKAAQGTRIVWIDELRKHKGQDSSMLKKIGDGMSLDAEILYGTTGTIPIHFKLFIISNHSPTFLHDKGMENRLRVLKFRSRFRDEVENDYPKCIFQKDRNLYEKLKGEWKHYLLDILFNYAHQYIQNGSQLPPIPQEFEEERQDVLSGNHTFQEWFEERYEVSQGYRYPKKIFDEEVQKEYEKQCNLSVGSVNVRDCLKSIDMYHYDKNMRFNIGDIKYR